MNTSRLYRRDILKLGAVATLSTLIPPLPFDLYPLGLGRVTVEIIYVYAQPDFSSERVGKRYRDDLLAILQELDSPHGPAHNPRWYRIDRGWVHSGRIQRVHSSPSWALTEDFPERGLLGEICVPYTTSQRYLRGLGWQPLYRLYFNSLHWITGVDEGPDEKAWYRVLDHLLNVEYQVPASHLRVLPDSIWEPLSPDLEPDQKRIEVSISAQTLTAYEAGQVVYETRIASGIHTENVPEGLLPTDTPLGSFRIQLKMPSRHMGDGRLTSSLTAYELPGVPWTCIFQKDGVGFHGTYWHANFGTRMSHGCINLITEDARWLFRWTHPVYTGEDYFVQGNGTLVVIQE